MAAPAGIPTALLPQDLAAGRPDPVLRSRTSEQGRHRSEAAWDPPDPLVRE